MDEVECSYVGTAHSQSESGFVAFTLARKDGGEFTVILRAEDGTNLALDVGTQARIACPSTD